MSGDLSQQMSYGKMLQNRRVLVAVGSSILAMILMFFYDSILADHLLDIGVSDSDVGYFFALVCLSYVLSAIAINFLTRHIKRRYISQSSFLIASLALMFFGPSKLFGFPEKSIPMTIVGLILIGLGASAIFIPILSEIIEAI